MEPETQEQLVARLEQLTRDNIASENLLAEKYQKRPHAGAVFNLRLNTLLDYIFHEDDLSRLEFEISYQEQIAGILKAMHERAKDEAGKAQLLVPDGVRLPPGIRL